MGILKTKNVPAVVMIVVLFISVFSLSSVSASNECDRAVSIFFKGYYSNNKESAYRFYMTAINLCPGFIRPYELVGNYYHKEGHNDKAIEFLTKAAQLGTSNYKLYYLLASLLFEKGDLEQAGKMLYQSHHSLETDFEASWPLSDTLIEDIEKSDIIINNENSINNLEENAYELYEKLFSNHYSSN